MTTQRNLLAMTLLFFTLIGEPVYVFSQQTASQTQQTPKKSFWTKTRIAITGVVTAVFAGLATVLTVSEVRKRAEARRVELFLAGKEKLSLPELEKLLNSAEDKDKYRFFYQNYFDEKGGDINHRGRLQSTPLMDAVMRNDIVIAQRLLEMYGADTNIPNSDDQTPLMIAAMHGKPDIVDLLLKHGAKVDSEDRWGNRPLNYAEGSLKNEVKFYREVGKPLPDTQKNLENKNKIIELIQEKIK